MSCKPGEPCEEGKKRRTAMGVLGLMALIFVALSFASFLDSRGQVIPSEVAYTGHGAVDGKRRFQAYNCMGCHTIVGNGAYLGPDLTKLYAKVGPAWLEAFLPSAGSWPTEAAVRVQLQKPAVADEAGVDTLETYFDKYPAAAERIHRRGGQTTMMPNLQFRTDEVARIIAFLKYTSQMDTEGWPPVPQVAGLTFPQPRKCRQRRGSRLPPRRRVAMIRWHAAHGWSRITAVPPAIPPETRFSSVPPGGNFTAATSRSMTRS
jgi:mono/diheme cytochrome c family protein